jgi:hypothetical protein
MTGVLNLHIINAKNFESYLELLWIFFKMLVELPTLTFSQRIRNSVRAHTKGLINDQILALFQVEFQSFKLVTHFAVDINKCRLCNKSANNEI